MYNTDIIPTGWAKAKISDLFDFIGGGTPSKKEFRFWNGEIPWASVKDIKGSYLISTQDTITEIGLANSAANIANPGEVILITRISPGKVITTKIKTAINQDLKIIRPRYVANPDFIRYLFNTLEKECIKLSSGTTVLGITLDILNDINIIIPPLNEQNRIVEKLDELLSELEKGKEQLQTSLEQLKVYRQSILKHAFEGKLTNNESDLQKQNFHSIIKLISGNTPKGVEKATNRGTIPFYRVSDMNLKGNEVEMRTSNVLLSEAEKEKLKIKTYPKGTIIFPKRGGAILTNKKRILGEVASFDLNLMGALPNEKVNSKYLFYWFVFLDLSKICDGSNVPQINYKNFDSIMFDYFEREIQIKIAEVIELQLSVCDEMESSIYKNLALSESLRSTILQKALEGKLIEQDPNDEPAEKLLERIRALRQTQCKQGKAKPEKKGKVIKSKNKAFVNG